MTTAAVRLTPEPPATPDGAGDGGVAPVAVPLETEAKLHASRRGFAGLALLDEVAGWRVVGRHDVGLRDTYWDTADRRLSGAGCTLRVREMRSGAPGSAGTAEVMPAELTLKGPVPAGAGAGPAGVWARTELTVPAPAGSGPEVWRTLPEARPLLAALERLGATDGLRPDVVLLNPRQEILLERGDGQVVVSLDEVAVEGAPYRRRYVEVELRRGDAGDLGDLVAVLAERYRLRPSRRAKVEAARAWMERRRGSQGPPLSR